jgi:putative ABC transport system substrate-binding protein
MMRQSRRQFVQSVGVAGLALAAGCGRLPWQAQAPPKVPRVGYLSIASHSSIMTLTDAFRHGLRELGYVEGHNIVIEYRSAEGSDERLPALAAELVGLPVDVIVAGSAQALLAAMGATSTIPIVAAQAGDPVGTGLVASLARPGGNLTGLINMGAKLNQKRLELLKDAVPSFSRVAVLANPGNPMTTLQLAETREAAQSLEVQLQILEVHRADAFGSAFEAASREGAEAMIILGSPLMTATAARLAELTGRSRLPAIHGIRDFVGAGGLMAYGADLRAQFRRAATYVDKILKGARPADLPIEQPTTFDFVINLRTAQALGLTIPPHVLLHRPPR